MAKRKYEHRHLITRTISTTSGDVLFFDSDAKENRNERPAEQVLGAAAG